ELQEQRRRKRLPSLAEMAFARFDERGPRIFRQSLPGRAIRICGEGLPLVARPEDAREFVEGILLADQGPGPLILVRDGKNLKRRRCNKKSGRGNKLAAREAVHGGPILPPRQSSRRRNIRTISSQRARKTMARESNDVRDGLRRGEPHV